MSKESVEIVVDLAHESFAKMESGCHSYTGGRRMVVTDFCT